MIRLCSGLLCLFLVSACGPKTTVVLLPEEDGKTGAVVIKNKSNEQILEKAYETANVTGEASKISVEEKVPEEINDQYQELMQAEPLKPVSILLYFQHGSAVLTKESQALIPEIFAIAQEREPSEVSIIGHTDSKGSIDYNNRLALERAQAIAQILKESQIQLKVISVKSHGENDPLVKTGDNVSEVKNRRVEIMIR